MFTQAVDFREESETLYQLLASRDDAVFSSETQFKRWTLNDVLVHLHIWNKAADWSLHEPERFDDFMQAVSDARAKGEHHQSVAYRWLGEKRKEQERRNSGLSIRSGLVGGSIFVVLVVFAAAVLLIGGGEIMDKAGSALQFSWKAIAGFFGASP